MNRIYVLIVLMIAVLAVSGCAASPSSVPGEPVTGIRVGNLAPDFTFTLHSEQSALSGLQGKPVLLNFWATWCGPCRFELPFLQDVYAEQSGGELVTLFVNLGEGVDAVMAFVRANKVIIPVVFDSNNEIARMYRISSIPATFFIDKNGIIRAVKIGAFSSKAEIEKNLKLIMP